MEALALISAIIGAASLGEGIYQGQAQKAEAKAASANQAAMLNAQQDAAKAAQQKAVGATISNQLPNIEAQTSGATTPEYGASVIGTSQGEGNPNVWQNAVSQWLGLSPNGAPATAGSGGGSPGMFPSEAVPAFKDLLPQQQGDPSAGLSGGST